MPELSGFEVLEALAQRSRTANIPVVVLTARADDADAQRGLALGARKYMSKPFDVRALIAEVQRHVGARAAEARGATGSLMKKILVVDDEDDILHFLDLVLREKGYRGRDGHGGPGGPDQGPARAPRPRAARHHDAPDGRLGGPEAAARRRGDGRPSRWRCSRRAPRPGTAFRASRKAPSTTSASPSRCRSCSARSRRSSPRWRKRESRPVDKAMTTSRARDRDYFRLRAEWLRFKNQVFDANAELPDARRRPRRRAAPHRGARHGRRRVPGPRR